VRGRKIDGVWYVHVASFDAYQESMRRRKQERNSALAHDRKYEYVASQEDLSLQNSIATPVLWKPFAILAMVLMCTGGVAAHTLAQNVFTEFEGLKIQANVTPSVGDVLSTLSRSVYDRIFGSTSQRVLVEKMGTTTPLLAEETTQQEPLIFDALLGTFATQPATSTLDRVLRVNASIIIRNNLIAQGSANIQGSLTAESGVFSSTRALQGIFTTLTGEDATFNTLAVQKDTRLQGNAFVAGNLSVEGNITTRGQDIDTNGGSVYAKNLINSLVAGRNIRIDATDPNNPVISAISGGGGGSTTIIEGSGSVTAGTIGQITYYATDGDTIVGTSSIAIDIDGMVHIPTASTTNLTVTGSFFQSTLTDCSDENYTLLYSSTTGSFFCGVDGGGGAGVVSIYEDGALVLANASGIDFNATDFSVTDDGSNTADIAIDYPSSHITRSTQDEIITGAWSFAGTSTASVFTASSTTATSTLPRLSTLALLLNGDYVTDLVHRKLLLYLVCKLLGDNTDTAYR